MVNELPLSYFTILTLLQIGLLFYAILNFNNQIYARAFASFFSAIVGYLNSNMILNGAIVEISDQSSTYQFVPIQSLPIHYLLLGLAVVSGIITVMFVIRIIQKGLTETSAFDKMEGW